MGISALRKAPLQPQPLPPQNIPFSQPRHPLRAPRPPSQFPRVPRLPPAAPNQWWILAQQALKTLAAPEVGAAALFLAPIGFTCYHYLQQQDALNEKVPFTPCGTEARRHRLDIISATVPFNHTVSKLWHSHTQTSSPPLTPEDRHRLLDWLSPHTKTKDASRKLADLERYRQGLRWYSDDDLAQLPQLNRDIESLKIQIADEKRLEEIRELSSRVQNTETRHKIHLLESEMGTLTTQTHGTRASTTPSIPPPPSSPKSVSTTDDDPIDVANDLAARLSVLRRYSNRTRREWETLAEQLENEDGTLLDKLPTIRAFIEAHETRIGDTRLHQPPPKWSPEPIVVPPPLRERLLAAYGKPDDHITIGDISRAYSYYFGEMGGLPLGIRGHRRHTDAMITQEIVYGDTVHRKLSQTAPLDAAEKHVKSQIDALAKSIGMFNFGGHWWALGIKKLRADRKTLPSTIRFYLSIVPQHALQLTRAIINIVETHIRSGHDVQFKINQDPREWRGDDGVVIYSGRYTAYDVWQKVQKLEDQHPEWFRMPTGTPLVTRIQKADGTLGAMSIAQSPQSATSSVNGPLAYYATRAMQWYRLQRARGLNPNVESIIQFTARQLKQNGRDLNHPAYLTQDYDTGLPGWATYIGIHVHTDQFLPDDVPLAKEIAEIMLEDAETDAETAAAQEILSTIQRRYPQQ